MSSNNGVLSPILSGFYARNRIRHRSAAQREDSSSASDSDQPSGVDDSPTTQDSE